MNNDSFSSVVSDLNLRQNAPNLRKIDEITNENEEDEEDEEASLTEDSNLNLKQEEAP